MNTLKVAAFDIETEVFDEAKNKHLLNVNFVCGGVVDWNGEEYYFTNLEAMINWLTQYDVLYVHNSSFDLGVINRAGFQLADSKIRDTLIMAFLIDENQEINLQALSEKYLGEGKTEKIKDGFVPQAACELTKKYVLNDARLTLKLGLLFSSELQNLGAEDLFLKVDMPFRRLMDRATQEGVLVNTKELNNLIEEFTIKVNTTKDKFLRPPYEVNIASPKQVGKLLYYFPQMIPTQKDGKPKTDSKTILSLPARLLKPEAQEILEYRKNSKLLNTFLLGLQNALWEDNCIRPLYNLTIARTGRTSSGGSRKSYPKSFNIQNVTKKNKEVRGLVRVKPNTKMVILDAKELELRVLAHYADETKLINTFKNNVDPHTFTAAALLRVDPKAISSEQRQLGKTLNYAALYGSTASGLEFNLQISLEEAHEMLQSFNRWYPGIKNLKRQVSRGLEEQGYVKSIFGRRRRGPLEEREAFSALVQGTAADLMKERCVSALAGGKLDPSYRLVLQIHDEFAFYVPEEKAYQAAQEIQAAFDAETEHRLVVPILFDVRISDSWAKTSC